MRGQGTVEYLLLMVAVILAIFYAVRATGPIQAGVNSALRDTETIINNAVSQMRGKLGL